MTKSIDNKIETFSETNFSEIDTDTLKNIVSVIPAKFRKPAKEGVVCLIGYVANNLYKD